MSDPTSPPDKPLPTPTVGSLIRDLRQASGWTRRQMEAYTGVAETDLRKVETGRALPSAVMLRRLLKSPALTDLPALAKRTGLVLDLGDSEKN